MKQIEEMARAIYNQPNSYDTYWQSHCEMLAEALYNAGYRKQSEWTSDERLPKARDYTFIALMARNGTTDFPEFKELEKAIENLPLRERTIARAHYLQGKKITELEKFYGYSERQMLRILASARKLMEGGEG